LPRATISTGHDRRIPTRENSSGALRLRDAYMRDPAPGCLRAAVHGSFQAGNIAPSLPPCLRAPRLRNQSQQDHLSRLRFCISNSNTAANRNRRNPLIQKEKTFSNRNKVGEVWAQWIVGIARRFPIVPGPKERSHEKPDGKPDALFCRRPRREHRAVPESAFCKSPRGYHKSYDHRQSALPPAARCRSEGTPPQGMESWSRGECLPGVRCCARFSGGRNSSENL